jgi:putative endonuclease
MGSRDLYVSKEVHITGWERSRLHDALMRAPWPGWQWWEFVVECKWCTFQSRIPHSRHPGPIAPVGVMGGWDLCVERAGRDFGWERSRLHDALVRAPWPGWRWVGWVTARFGESKEARRGVTVGHRDPTLSRHPGPITSAGVMGSGDLYVSKEVHMIGWERSRLHDALMRASWPGWRRWGGWGMIAAREILLSQERTMGREKHFFVYILASKPRGVLYVGVTSDLPGRAWEHRERITPGFATRYWVNRLVYFEHQATADLAISREKSLKRWRRNWKIDLIERDNPTWRDLFDDAIRVHGLDPA